MHSAGYSLIILSIYVVSLGIVGYCLAVFGGNKKDNDK